MLGKGAFGQVYEAQITGTSHHVAVKIIEKRSLKSEEMVRRVKNEVTIHYQLRHPNILELYHFFEDASHVYLVTEVCSHGELYQYMQKKQGKLEASAARRLFRDIALGMDYLHAHGIIHRDLKLSNILLDKDHRAKIGDFGLAVRVNNPWIAEQQTICGTPNYLPPEILDKQPYGLSADVWSLGCLLYTFLVGRPPFEEDELWATFERARRADVNIPTTLPPDAADLLRSLIVKRPGQRLTMAQIMKHPFLRSASFVNERIGDASARSILGRSDSTRSMGRWKSRMLARSWWILAETPF